MKLAKMTREALFCPATSGGVAERDEDMQGLRLSCRDAGASTQRVSRIMRAVHATYRAESGAGRGRENRRRTCNTLLMQRCVSLRYSTTAGAQGSTQGDAVRTGARVARRRHG